MGYLAEWKKKASFLNDNISKGGSFRIVQGQVVLLCGNREVIASRVRIRQKTSDYTARHIDKMYKDFDRVFSTLDPKITIVDTHEHSIHEVVKRVARIIHMDEYSPSDLHHVLDLLIKPKK